MYIQYIFQYITYIVNRYTFYIHKYADKCAEGSLLFWEIHLVLALSPPVCQENRQGMSSTLHCHHLHRQGGYRVTVGGLVMDKSVRFPTRWAPHTSYKWSYNPYKWPYKWATGVITLLIEVITPLVTGSGPPCKDLFVFL